MAFKEDFRAGQRAVWSAGDWPTVAETIQPVADELVERAGVAEGQEVLDIGTGSGNVAIRAAERGAVVTGVDVTPELFDAGRVRAKQAGVEVEWVEGDAAELPFEDGSFDRALSVFGAMFAPTNQDAADEIFRVTRPGGLFGCTAWTPEGLNGQMLATMGAALPPPPEEADSPMLWGEEDHVRGLFEGVDVELSFEKEMAVYEEESLESLVAMYEENLGPVIMAKMALSEQGKWDDMRRQLVDLYGKFATDVDGGVRVEAEYLRTIGSRRA